MTTDRRTFIAQAAASMVAISIARDQAGPPPHAGTAQPRALDGPRLAALGETVLPESLGAAGRAKAVLAFREWIAAYVPVSEQMHGYGYAEITYTPADPAPGWNAQLEALELLARKQFGAGFPAVDAGRRDALVRGELAGIRAARLPANPLTAPHVAIALVAHWAASSDATDLAYGVRIGKDNCRALAASPRQPLPLLPGGEG
jgi:hypothetical protein